MSRPERVQLKRERGWRLPPNTVKVDRTTKFGNPFSTERYGLEQSIALYRSWITGEMSNTFITSEFPVLISTHLLSRQKALRDQLQQLAGKNLACWCSLDSCCHAGILLELANADGKRRTLLKAS